MKYEGFSAMEFSVPMIIGLVMARSYESKQVDVNKTDKN
jgi:hypothetical protein